MIYQTIGGGLPDVSLLSLGSWNTFSRIRFEESVALVGSALDQGVNLFDVGYYWDKPHTEVIFGRVLQVLGRPRSSYLLAEKLWLWDYPQQSFADQLRGSLLRLGVDQVDLVMVSRPLPGMDFIAFCEEVVALVDAGLARAWGVTNWEPEEIVRAHRHCAALGRPAPCMVQLQYNVARRAVVENAAYARAFAETGIRLCAAHTLEGGILAGHLERDRVQPSEAAQGKVPLERNIARDAGNIRERIRGNYPLLQEVASQFGVTPAQAALALCMSHPAIGTVLVGVTRLADLDDNIKALSLLPRSAELRAALAPLAIGEVGHPRLFSPQNE
jgi:aryl-alcohol dehydrogenase-like predicted oxidoreductase